VEDSPDYQFDHHHALMKRRTFGLLTGADMPRHIIVNLEPHDQIVTDACKAMQQKKSKKAWIRELCTVDDIPGSLTTQDKAYVCAHGGPVEDGKMAGKTPFELAQRLAAAGLRTVGQINLIMCGGPDPDSVLAQDFTRYLRGMGFTGIVIAYNRNLTVSSEGTKHFSTKATRDELDEIDDYATLAATQPPNSGPRLADEVARRTAELKERTAIKNNPKVKVTLRPASH
jgi:hypothetical protein